MYEVHIWWRGQHYYECMCQLPNYDSAIRELTSFYQNCVHDFMAMSPVAQQRAASNNTITFRINLLVESCEPVHMEIWSNVQ